MTFTEGEQFQAQPTGCSIVSDCELAGRTATKSAINARPWSGGERGSDAMAADTDSPRQWREPAYHSGYQWSVLPVWLLREMTLVLPMR